jgi:hypothetical protein
MAAARQNEMNVSIAVVAIITRGTVTTLDFSGLGPAVVEDMRD